MWWAADAERFWFLTDSTSEVEHIDGEIEFTEVVEFPLVEGSLRMVSQSGSDAAGFTCVKI